MCVVRLVVHMFQGTYIQYTVSYSLQVGKKSTVTPKPGLTIEYVQYYNGTYRPCTIQHTVHILYVPHTYVLEGFILCTVCIRMYGTSVCIISLQ